MNRLENWFCATNFWRNITQRRLLPWMLDGSDLGDSVLDLGAGPGAATSYLREKFARVTSLEYSAAFAQKIARDSRQEICLHNGGQTSASITATPGKVTVPVPGKVTERVPEKIAAPVPGQIVAAALGKIGVVCGDAAQLPFAAGSFSCVLAILVLHHLRSGELQDAALREIVRVLRPGGVFLALEIHDGWLQRLVHTRSTFVPFVASSANGRLNAAGFARVAVDFMRGGFLLRAQRGTD